MKAEISLADSLIATAQMFKENLPSQQISSDGAALVKPKPEMRLVFAPVQSDFSVPPATDLANTADSRFDLEATDDAGFLFEGRHFLASYSGCDFAKLTDIEGMLEAFRNATRASGATILNENHHIFPPHGLTALLLLSESHASIHTYPEHAACFVDLFTCGDHCDARAFHKVMLSYLKPTEVQAKTMLRNTHFEELQGNDHD